MGGILLGDGAREEAREEATMALASEEMASSEALGLRVSGKDWMDVLDGRRGGGKGRSGTFA